MNELSLKEHLIELISNMSEDSQIGLLHALERQQRGYRKYPRRPCSIETDYTIQKRAYKDFIKNISAGGIYITTKQSQSVGDEVSLNFRLSGYEKPIRVFGKIVRSNSNGFAVEFYEKVEELLNSK